MSANLAKTLRIPCTSDRFRVYRATAIACRDERDNMLSLPGWAIAALDRDVLTRAGYEQHRSGHWIHQTELGRYTAEQALRLECEKMDAATAAR